MPHIFSQAELINRHPAHFSSRGGVAPYDVSQLSERGAKMAMRQYHTQYVGGEISPDDPAFGYEINKPDTGHEASGRFKVFFESLPAHAPLFTRKFIEKYGDAVIVDAKMCRVPIKQRWLISLGNVVTLGGLESKRKQLQKTFGSVYDDVFHLYVVLKIKTPDGETLDYLIEKNEKVEVKLSTWDGHKDFRGDSAECIHQPPKSHVTIAEMFQRAEKAVGGKTLWEYDLSGSNCQAFSIAILGSGNSMLTTTGRNFALQDVQYLLPKWIAKIAKGGTDFANKVKSFMFGKGLE